MAKTEFTIEQTRSGVDVKLKGRAFAYDLDDLEEALQRIRRQVGRGILVTYLDVDGYPTKVKT